IGAKYKPDLVVQAFDMTDFHDDLVARERLARVGAGGAEVSIFRAFGVGASLAPGGAILLPVPAAGGVRALLPDELGGDPRDGAAGAGDGRALRAVRASALPAVRPSREPARPRAPRVPGRGGGPAGAVRVLRAPGADGEFPR